MRSLKRGLDIAPDAYPLSEGDNGVTRPAVQELVSQGRPFNVITKGLGVRRDFDLLQRLDPQAPLSGDRLARAREARDAGILVRMSIAPWIPHLTSD